MQWTSVLYHPDWRYLDIPGHGRYVVRRTRRRGPWIATLNGNPLPAGPWSTRERGIAHVNSKLWLPVNTPEAAEPQEP